MVPNADFIAKLTPTLASGQGAPDIFTGESDYVKYLVDSGFWMTCGRRRTAPTPSDVGLRGQRGHRRLRRPSVP